MEEDEEEDDGVGEDKKEAGGNSFFLVSAWPPSVKVKIYSQFSDENPFHHQCLDLTFDSSTC